jgi:hypothetical protein
VAGRKLPDRPAKVLGIPVNATFNKLHVLHATGWGGGGEVLDGTIIGYYVLQYDDHSAHSIPIVYGNDVRDWHDHDGFKPTTSSKLGWVGTNAFTSEYGIRLRLYVSTWENPHPERRVLTIDCCSTNTLCAPFCIAMTVEETVKSTSSNAQAKPPPDTKHVGHKAEGAAMDKAPK